MILNKYFLENPTLHHTAITLQQAPLHSASYPLRQTADTMGSAAVSVSPFPCFQVIRNVADWQTSTAMSVVARDRSSKSLFDSKFHHHRIASISHSEVTRPGHGHVDYRRCADSISDVDEESASRGSTRAVGKVSCCSCVTCWRFGNWRKTVHLFGRNHKDFSLFQSC